MIYSVAYRSVPAMSCESREREVRAILSKARTTNATLGITGALLISSGHFIQIVEGDQPVVDALIARIEQDTRHTGFTIFFREFGEWRRFSNWAMAWLGGGLDSVIGLPLDELDATQVMLKLLAEHAQ